MVKKFTAQKSLRSAYIGKYPVYKSCADCLAQFFHNPTHPLAGKPALSKFPYCLPCLKRNAADPDFVKWLKELFGVGKLK